jgi:GAF domain-containing protein
MEPIPETLEALGELDTYLDEETLLDQLRRSADLARRIAPDLVGISIASQQHGVTLTLVATDDEIAALDGIQYLTGGPCVDAVHDSQGMATTSADLFDEPRWLAFASATAAAGVRSTLTFPIMEDDIAIGTVNLYGASDDTFDGKHRLLATIFHAWAPGAVVNADLSFSTRRLAQKAPAQLREDAVIDAATGLLAASRGVSFDDAREQLEESAARAGVPVGTLARLVIELHNHER